MVKYLLDLRTSLPLFASIDSLNIKKETGYSIKVRANINFNLYLLI